MIEVQQPTKSFPTPSSITCIALPSQYRAKSCGIFRISIHDQETRVPKERPLGIGESKAATAESLLQQSILRLQILDSVKLSTIDPAGK